jgi:hypothetical protein
MRLLLLSACALLTACSGAPKLPERVLVPVATPCISAPIPAPAFISDADLLKAGDYEFVILLSKDRLERKAYIGLLEAAVSGCT